MGKPKILKMYLQRIQNSEKKEIYGNFFWIKITFAIICWANYLKIIRTLEIIFAWFSPCMLEIDGADFVTI